MSAGQAPIRPSAEATAATCALVSSRGWVAPGWAIWPWEMITGSADASRTAMMVSKPACAQSITMPSRLHSATVARSNRLSPPCTAGSA